MKLEFLQFVSPEDFPDLASSDESLRRKTHKLIIISVIENRTQGSITELNLDPRAIESVITMSTEIVTKAAHLTVLGQPQGMAKVIAGQLNLPLYVVNTVLSRMIDIFK
jgi:hypothetical protein